MRRKNKGAELNFPPVVIVLNMVKKITPELLQQFYAQWNKSGWDMYEGLQRLSRLLNCSVNCAEAIWYLSGRSRGTPDRLNRLLVADQRAGQFDWNSVVRGDEDEELQRLGL